MIDHVYRTKAELVYLQLRDSIAEGSFRPGDRLVLDRIAREFGVSKVPVREAVTRLVGEGWLHLQPHVGPVVPLLSADEILETGLIRGSLEATAVRMSVSQFTAVAAQEAELAFTAMAASTADPASDFATLNRSFHLAIMAACPYSRLSEMVRTVGDQTSRYQTARRIPSYISDTQIEHRAILQAALRHDAGLAGDLTYSHITHAAELLARQLSVTTVVLRSAQTPDSTLTADRASATE